MFAGNLVDSIFFVLFMIIWMWTSTDVEDPTKTDRVNVIPGRNTSRDLDIFNTCARGICFKSIGDNNVNHASRRSLLLRLIRDVILDGPLCSGLRHSSVVVTYAFSHHLKKINTLGHSYFKHHIVIIE